MDNSAQCGENETRISLMCISEEEIMSGLRWWLRQ